MRFQNKKHQKPGTEKTENIWKKIPAERINKVLFLTKNFGVYKNQKTMKYIYPHENEEKSTRKICQKIT